MTLSRKQLETLGLRRTDALKGGGQAKLEKDPEMDEVSLKPANMQYVLMAPICQTAPMSTDSKPALLNKQKR